MNRDRSVYENIDRSSARIGESVFSNPIFDEHDANKVGSTVALDSLLSKSDEQSPCEEVAVNISNTDDPTVLCVTYRSVFIGILLICLMSFVAQFFAYRTSPLDVSIGIVILLSYMCGQLAEKTLPATICGLRLNPGPMSMKEYALITMMGSSGIYTHISVECLTVQRLYYKFHINHFTGISFILIMQFLAFSLAGILRRYLIWPASMVWPKSIMGCSLIRTLAGTNSKQDLTESSWPISRVKFFWLVVLLQFVWYWVPGYIFPLLSLFSVVCLIFPNHLVLSQITGANGLGIGAIELDWNAWVAYLDSPILVPFWSHANIFFGFVIAIWIATPIVYYTNTWNSQLMPIISNRVFDKNGDIFNATKILDNRLRLNQTAYRIYGEMNSTAGTTISYGFMFAGVSALVIHTILYHGQSIVEQYRSGLADANKDVHAKLMSYYPEASDWWYYLLFCASFAIGMVHFHYVELIPAYMFLGAIILTIILILPNGIIVAMTNMSWINTAPGDLLSSVLLLGNPISFLSFRAYTYSCQSQVIIYLTNLKIAHYMKIPPRVSFTVLLLSSIISSVVHYTTAIYLLTHVPDICTSKNPAWRCLNTENAHTSSVIFGLVGSFTRDPRYSPVLYGFLIGAVCPFITWFLWRKFPHITWLGLVNTPLILLATNSIPPAPAAAYPSWFAVGFIFNYVIYRYAHHWWQKYAFIFSGAMSCGVALCGLVIFYVFQLNRIAFPSWWGLGGKTADGCPLASANYSGIIPTGGDL